MLKFRVFSTALACLAIAAATAGVHASGHGRTLVVTMTNDQNSNEIKVYDAESHALLQTLSTHGKGGAGGNARGIKQYGSGLVAAVNNGSGNVALFRREGDALKFDQVIQTTSAPVSVDFGNDHLYVAGATTVDSFVLRENSVEWLDGTTGLAVAGGGNPAAGETSQVGAISAEQLLVTIKTDPNPGTVDVIALHRGRIAGAAPTAVSAPQGSLAPFGFSTSPGWHRAHHAGALRPGWIVPRRGVHVGRCGRSGGLVLVDTGRQVRLRCQYRQSDDQPSDRDGQQRLRRCADRRAGPDRVAGGHRRGFGRARRHRSWCRSVAPFHLYV